MNSRERHQIRYERRHEKRLQKRQEMLEKYGDFNEIVSRNSLSKSADMCTRNVAYKSSVKHYMLTKPVQIERSFQDLQNFKDVHKSFICFNVMERGKLRKIMSLRYSERVIHKALNQNALLPMISRSLIWDNGASQEGKGTKFSLERLVTHLRRFYRLHGNNGYILQVDIKNYFGSIDHEIVKKSVKDLFDDQRISDLICGFVDAYYEFYHAHPETGYPDEKAGLGLGSELNQTHAIAYLNPLDHFIKEKLQIKYYGRYNDDFYLIHEDLEYLKHCEKEIIKFCITLKLEVNTKKTHITKLSHSFTFLKTQFLLTDSGKIIKKPSRESITRERRKLHKQAKLLDKGELQFDDIRSSFDSWKGSLKYKTARRSVYNMEKMFNKLFIEDWLHDQPLERSA